MLFLRIRGRGRAGRRQGLAAARIWPLPAGGRRESGDQKGEGQGAPDQAAPAAPSGARSGETRVRAARTREGADGPWRRRGGAAGWRPSGTSGCWRAWRTSRACTTATCGEAATRAIWAGAGYPRERRRPEARWGGGLCAGRAGCALSRVSCLCFLLHSLHPERLMPRLEGGVGADRGGSRCTLWDRPRVP